MRSGGVLQLGSADTVRLDKVARVRRLAVKPDHLVAELNN